MGRPKGTTDLTAAERRRIRSLFRKGVRVTDIVRMTGRSESVVYRNTRDLKRKRPPPPSGKHASRNDRILRLAEQGKSRAQIGRIFGLSPSQVGTVIMRHPHIAWLLRKRRLRPAAVAKRYRMEVSTARRIAGGARAAKIKRTRGSYCE